MKESEFRIIPEVNELTKPYWEGAAQGKLMLQKCCTCGLLRHPPSVLCPECWNQPAEWVSASGYGVIYSYTIVTHAVHRSVEGKVPYNVVLVELDEGARMVSSIVDAPPEEILIGGKVSVVFEILTPEIGLPKFRLVDGTEKF